MPKIMIDPDLCNRCSMCVFSCPLDVFTQEKEKTLPEIVKADLCYSCGHCAALCPSGALTHEDFPTGSIRPLNSKFVPSLEQIQEMIRSRRSIRAYKDKPVEKELIEKIIDGARFAPSGMNQQTTEYIVISDKAVLQEVKGLTYRFFSRVVKLLRNPIIRRLAPLAGKEIRGVLRILSELEGVVVAYKNGKDSILHDAPLLMIFHGEEGFAFSDINAALALHNASLVCQGSGLGCFISGLVIPACRKDKKIPKLLSIPKDHKVFGALVIGYPKFTYKNWIGRRPPKIQWV